MIREKLLQFSKEVILYISLAVYIFLSLTSFFSTAYFDMTYLETTHYKRDFIPLHLLVLILFFLLLYMGEKRHVLEKISSQKLCIILLCYGAVFSGIWSIGSHAVPTADPFLVADSAADFIRGDFYYLSPGKYLQIYPQQIGYVAYLEILFRIFGPYSYWAVEAFNTGLICLEFYMIYKITGVVFGNKKITNLVLFLLFGCLPYLFYVTLVYGELLGAPLALLAVYFCIRFTREEKISQGILTALFLGASVIAKQNNLIVVIALILYLLLKGLERKKISCLLVIALCLLCIRFFDAGIKKQYEIRSGYEMGNGVSPLLHIAMGMQEGDMAEGWYNGYILKTFWDHGENFSASTDQAALDIQNSVSHFLQNPAYAVKFYYKKIVSQWNNPTYECLWISHFENSHDAPLSVVVQSLYEGKLHRIFLFLVDEYHWLLFAGASLGMFLYRKRFTLEQLILAVIILGGFFFHILWEAKSRFILVYFILLIPYGAAGYVLAIEQLKKRVESAFPNGIWRSDDKSGAEHKRKDEKRKTI